MITTSGLKKRNSLRYLKYAIIEFWAYLTCLVRFICKWILNETIWVEKREEEYKWIISLKDIEKIDDEDITINGIRLNRNMMIELFREYEFEVLDIEDLIYTFFYYNDPSEYRKLDNYDHLFATLHANQVFY